MMYPIPQFNKQLNYFCHVTDVFSKEEVKKILDLEDLTRFLKGNVGDGNRGELNIVARDSDVMWIQPTDGQNGEALWLFEKFAHLTAQINQDHFLFDIDHLQAFQYTVYRENQHYTWHVDIANTWLKYERKISATIILTDPDEYEGGEFETILGGNAAEPVVLKPNKGDVVFFASWMPHRVRPITNGVRKSLVAWVMGQRNW